MKKFHQAFSIQFFVLFLILLVPAVSAQTFEVSRTDDPVPDGCDSGTDCSIREAIIAANDVGSGTATIQLVGGQTYTLSIPNSNPNPTTIEELLITTNGSLKILNTDATIRIEATGSGMATIDANNIDRVFLLFEDTDVEMEALEITGGNPGSGGGGGIYVIGNMNLEITNSSITGNVAGDGNSYGGGIRGTGATITILESTISDNEAGFQGGGLDLGDFEGVLSNITIENSVISNNFSGSYGGAIDTDDTDLVIIESSISGNRGEDNGGGLYVWGGNVTINRSAVINNSARDESLQGGFGGGINANGGDILILNSTISGNETGNGVNSGTAGGIYVTNFSDALIDIVNSTLTDNTGWSIGGIYNGTGTINVSNSIIANQAVGDDCSGTINSNGYNIDSDETCGFTETGDQQNVDPILDPLQDNGGPVFTHALSTDPLSPAINNGNNTLYTDAGGDLENDSDANGNDRVYDGGTIDIGAFEVQQNVSVVGCPATSDVLYVKKGENGSGANWFNALGELRDALAMFENETCSIDDVEEIWVTAGTYLPTDDSSDREATFNMISELDVLGGFAGSETNKNQRNWESNIAILSGDIDGDETLAGNSYHVVTATNDGFAAILDGFTISGGNANGSSPHSTGGGLYANNATLYVSNSRFDDNFAASEGGGVYATDSGNLPVFFQVIFSNNETDGDGGGLAVNNSNPRLTHVTFENNTAEQYGGGMFNVNSAPLLRNVFFTNNFANSQGGGMANDRSAPELYNVEFTENSARINGGAIDNAFEALEGTLSLYNVTISRNEVVLSNGGGIYNRNGAVLDIHNSIIWGNSAGGTGNQIWNANISSAVLSYSLYGNEPGDIVEGGGFTAENSLTTNPVFTDASDGDFTLASTSAAINSGDPDTNLDPFEIQPSTPIDLAGNPRVYNGDVDIIDIGSYEFQGEPGDSGPAFAPFITTWQVEADDLDITIPITGSGYNFTVEWGDETNTDWQDGDDINELTHSYSNVGIYTVEITGDFPRIFFNLDFSSNNREKIQSVEQWGDVEWSSMNKAFAGTSNLQINASDAPDLSNVADMSYMFQNASKVNADFDHWDVSTIELMRLTFEAAGAFNGNIDNWNTGMVTDMFGMFSRAAAFNRDISSWDVSMVENMGIMFNNTQTFNIDISGWETGSVTNMSGMFFTALAFNESLGGLDISGATDMSEMLNNSGLSTENYDNTLIGWAAQTVQSEIELGASGLTYCESQEERQSLMDDDNWTITGDAFSESCSEFQPFITTWQVADGDLDITIPTAAGQAYDYDVDWGDTTSDTGLNGDANHTYGSEGTYTVKITGTFPQIEFANGGDKDKIMSVEQWGDIEWESMRKAFEGATNLEINAEDTPDLSNATSMLQMFSGATSVNGGLENWDVSTITSMFGLFNGAISFNGDISGWNVSAVTDMILMFAGATSFNQDIGSWEIGSVNVITSMFQGATSFNQDISEWDTGNVTGMFDMFENAETLNQNLGGWDISNVTTMGRMLDGTALSTENYDNTLIGWAAQTTQEGVDLGADGLSYCNGEDGRQSLISDENWTITGDGLASECLTPEGEDQRILVSNASDYEFSKSDFGVSNNNYFIKIETLPAEGTLELDGSAVSEDDEISVQDINGDQFTWDMPDGEYGYNFTSFEFRIVDDSENQSENPYTLTVDLGSTIVELSGSQGWRFMSNPSGGDYYSDLFSGITVQTDAPSSQTLYELNQAAYEWDPVGSTGDEPGVGTPFIIYVLEGDLPETVESGDNWNDLDGGYSFSGPDYDAAQDEPNPDDFYLLGNPHPIALDFCQFEEENIATSAYFWDPEANGGNGDYLSLNCATPEDVLIAPFQAFWIRTIGASPALDIPMEAYLEGTTEGYFKEKSEGDERFLITLQVSGENGLFTNRAQILFADDATAGLDRFDAPKLSAEGLASQWLSFHSLDENRRPYAFQSLPASQLSNEKVSIPLDIQTTESGRFILDWSLPESHMFNGSYFLKDNQNGEVIELRQGSTYSFEISPEQAVQTKQAEATHPMSEIGENGAIAMDTHPMSSWAGPRFELLIAGTGVDGFTELGAVPEAFELAQNYPNPFNPTTVISYQLPVNSEVRLEVYDMLGRNVATLINGRISAGRHTVNFNASGLSSGIYLYRLQAGSQIMTRKLTVVK